MPALDIELRFGEEIGIFEADASEGDAVGEAEGLLGLTELEADLAADTTALLELPLADDALEEAADER